MAYRKDINGLRAIAVIAVLLFHFNSSWLPGGFAGVDVFFVISGFLMTKIIVSGVEKNTFSIWGFYLARANRIIPALAFLCFSLLIIGWLFLTPMEYKALGKHSISSLSFLSNIVYWREAGYFDAASNEKWLLHTWSLSVEWQFYIIYPLILITLKRISSIRTIKPVLLFGTTLGFIFAAVITYSWPNSAYYLLPTRAWEMMLGGVAYLYPFKIEENKKKFLEWFGLILILSSYFFISKDDLWPGYYALIPTLGTFFVIQSHRSFSLITGNILAQKVGVWSYSIYLWHWPVVVALNYFSLNGLWILFGISLSLMLGFISNRYIERVNLNVNWLILKPSLVAIFSLMFASVIYFKDGFISRFGYIEGIEVLSSNRKAAEDYYRSNLMFAYTNNSEELSKTYLCSLDGGRQTITSVSNCLKHKLSKNGYLIIGDSHGRDFLHALKLAYPTINFAMLHQSSCAPTEYKLQGSSNHMCFNFLNKLRDEFVINNPAIKGVILASSYGDVEGVNYMVSDVQNSLYGSLPVYIVNAGPVIDKDIVDLAIKNQVVNSQYMLGNANKRSVQVNRIIGELNNQAKVFDKYSSFCGENQICILSSKYTPYIWDNGHLSWSGIQFLSKAIKSERLLN